MASVKDNNKYENINTAKRYFDTFIFCSFIFAVPYIVIDDDRGVATPEKFYKVGSTIELKCIIDKIPNRSSYVLWKHGERMLNYGMQK